MTSPDGTGSEFAVVAVVPRRIAMVRSLVSLADIPRAQREARTALEAAGIGAGEGRLTLWRPPQDGMMEYAPAVFAPDGVRVPNTVDLFTLPEGRAAHLRMRGSYAGLPAAWGRLFAGIAAAGFVPAGLNWEVYAPPDTPPQADETGLYALLT